jgi:hypothetical protein
MGEAPSIASPDLSSRLAECGDPSWRGLTLGPVVLAVVYSIGLGRTPLHGDVGLANAPWLVRFGVSSAPQRQPVVETPGEIVASFHPLARRNDDERATGG